MFLSIIFILGIVSILWALWSLRGLKKDKKVEGKVKKELATGRVIFHHSSTTSEDALE